MLVGGLLGGESVGGSLLGRRWLFSMSLYLVLVIFTVQGFWSLAPFRSVEIYIFLGFWFTAFTQMVLGLLCCFCSFWLFLYCVWFYFVCFVFLFWPEIGWQETGPCFMVVRFRKSERVCYKNSKGSGSFNPKESCYWHIGLIPQSEFLRVACSKDLFMLVIVQGVVGTWILIPCWRLIHLPSLHFNYSLQCSLFILFFFKLVSRPYACLLGCTCD